LHVGQLNDALRVHHHQPVRSEFEHAAEEALGLLELLALSLRLAQQLLRAQVAPQDLEAHGRQRHHLREQRVLPRIERAEGRQFDDAHQRVLRQQRRGNDARRRRGTESRRDAQVLGGHAGQRNRRAIACALANQPLAQAKGRRDF